MKTILDIQGMHCQGCVARLKKAFEATPGVQAVSVTLNPPRAVIESDAPVALETLSNAATAAGNYTISHAAGPGNANAAGTRHVAENAPADSFTKPSLYPLFLIVGYIAGVVAVASYIRGPFSWHAAMNDFMAGFFLVFSFFKLLDLQGFASAYRMYDLPARWIPAWAFVYPFVELALGVAYLAHWNPTTTNLVTLALMLIGAAGVLQALLNKRAIRCACLGTALNLPMTTVTLVEDLGMAAMAAVMLLWR